MVGYYYQNVRDQDRAESEAYEKLGLILSLCFHCCIAVWFFLFSNRQIEIPEAPIYSVTMEGGKTIGGRSQVAENDKKSQVAPPKNVSEPAPKKEQQAEEKKVEEKKEVVKEEQKKIENKKEENTVPLEKPKEVPPVKEQPKKEEPAKKDEKKTEKTEGKVKPPDKKEKPVDINKEFQNVMQRYLGDSTEAGGKGFGAAKIGGESMGGGVVKPREFFLYLEKLKNTLKGHWTWFDKNNLLIATVQIFIEPNGDVTSVRIRKTSGNSLFDESVIRAVKEASPVPPPPAVVYNDFRIVDIVFDPRDT